MIRVDCHDGLQCREAGVVVPCARLRQQLRKRRRSFGTKRVQRRQGVTAKQLAVLQQVHQPGNRVGIADVCQRLNAIGAKFLQLSK